MRANHVHRAFREGNRPGEESRPAAGEFAAALKALGRRYHCVDSCAVGGTAFDIHKAVDSETPSRA